MNAALAGSREVRFGLRENAAQFSLLVLINAFVGLMVGLERAVLPLIGKQSFHLTSDVAVLTYLIAFGFSKAFTNLAAGALAARLGRRRLLIAGWAAALPVPLLIQVAPSWAWVVAANIFLGINQGLAWSMTVVMKIDSLARDAAGSRSGSTRPPATVASRSPPASAVCSPHSSRRETWWSSLAPRSP
jgi:MFS family permease